MVNLLLVLSIILAAYGIGRYISFSFTEGKDERGKFILAKASHITLSFLFAIYAILLLLIVFSNISAQVLGLVLAVLMSLLFLINGLSIQYLRRIM